MTHPEAETDRVSRRKKPRPGPGEYEFLHYSQFNLHRKVGPEMALEAITLGMNLVKDRVPTVGNDEIGDEMLKLELKSA